MSRKNFDYGYTCPDIDKEISNFESTLNDNLIDLISELNPMFSETNKEREYREGWAESIYDSAENCFEKVRETNQDMRKEAEYQIENLIEELEEARRLANYWESEAEEKDRRISDLEEEVDRLSEISA